MNEAIFDHLDRLGSDYTNGYGPLRIPSPIDDEVKALVDLLIQCDPAERRDASSLMTSHHASVLSCYAFRNASRAVRERRPDLISHSLSALALGWARILDERDELPVLSLLYRSGELIDLPAISPSVYPIAVDNPEFEAVWNRFRTRPESLRNINVMQYTEGSDQDGFRFTYTGPTCTLEDMLRKLERSKNNGGNIPESTLDEFRRQIEIEKRKV
jgi:hypothetical protein